MPPLTKLKGATLRTLHRIAKHPTKGARPFFADPHAMIALRQATERNPTDDRKSS